MKLFKEIKKNVLPFLIVASLGVGISTMPGCSSDDEDDGVTPCEKTCQNGGEKGFVDGVCFCACPSGFTGPNCEIESDCPPSAECPIGYFANPANDCKCEKIN